MSLDDSTRRARRRRQQIRTRALVGVGALALSTLVFGPAAQGLTELNLFELEGNAAASGNPGDDWADLLPGGAASSDLTFTGILPDFGANDDIYTGGGSKDDLDIPQWRHTQGSVPDKDDITNAYAAAYEGPGDDLLVYFGLDRYAQNGDANVGFWFLQDPLPLDTSGQIDLPADGTFGTMDHEVGDVLVLSTFSNGGAVSGIQVYKWNPGAIGAVNGVLQPLYSAGANAKCGLEAAGADACGIANEGADPITSPWPYHPKRGADNLIPKGGFFEGGVNLTDLFSGQTPCFSTFLAETRASTSVDATLKDFVAGRFDLCDASIQITGNGVNEVGDTHTFTVTLNALFGGASSPPPAGTPVTVTLTETGGADIVESTLVDNCGSSGTDSSGQCTVTFTSNAAGSITGSASASIPVGDTTLARSTDGVAPNSGTVLKRFVDARVSITPDDTNNVTEPHTFVVDADYTTGGGTWAAATVGHADVTLTSDPTSMDTALTSTPASDNTCHNVAAHTGGADNLDSSGQCKITFVSTKAGTVTGNATVELAVTVSGTTLTIVRSTGGTTPAPNSADAVKTYVDGSLKWVKHDGDPALTGDDRLLGGATFTVCRTHTLNTATNPDSLTDITDICVDVLDNDATDVDEDDGQFEMQDLILGTWTVVEKTAPAGYVVDPNTRTVNLTLGSPDGTVTQPFVNERLYRMIVVTCNTVTETLVESEVNFDDGIASTPNSRDTLVASQLFSLDSILDSDETFDLEEAICGLAGANYDNIPKSPNGSPYQPSVELPRR